VRKSVQNLLERPDEIQFAGQNSSVHAGSFSRQRHAYQRQRQNHQGHDNHDRRDRCQAMPLLHCLRQSPVQRSKHNGGDDTPENGTVKRPENPSEGERYRDDQSEKNSVFEGAHIDFPLDQAPVPKD
jgi:hypothetical protein